MNEPDKPIVFQSFSQLHWYLAQCDKANKTSDWTIFKAEYPTIIEESFQTDPDQVKADRCPYAPGDCLCT